MIKLNKKELEDKIHACWIGKNIGGTMGGPFEGRKEILDIKGFTTPENVVLANDDLDLQLVWLEAVKRVGVRNINSLVLGEFWLSYIVPYWNEYGRCKTNMKAGILPPLAGDAYNTWKHSNGGWIRTEIWACLAPGAPDVAVKYAYEDSSVDHGTGEGTVSALFVAAVESAAFVETDLRKLLEIGLSKIPKESDTAKSIKFVIECYDKGMEYKEVRNKVFELNKHIGSGWFEAPSNIAYAIIGLLWGKGDFKKSMIYTINCGDDTDCTAGIVGSILGIMGGTEIIPEEWKNHIGDGIETVALAKGILYGYPQSCTELTKTVLQYIPQMLLENDADVEITDGENEVPNDVFEIYLKRNRENEVYNYHFPYSYKIDFNYASAVVIYEGDPDISPFETKKIKIRFINNISVYGNVQYFLKLRFLSSDGFEVRGPKSLLLSRCSPFDADFLHDQPWTDAELEITAGESVNALNRIVIEVIAEGRVTAGYIPVILIGK